MKRPISMSDSDVGASWRSFFSTSLDLQADETALEQALLATLEGLVVAVNQVVVLPWNACSLVARITATDSLDLAAQQVPLYAAFQLSCQLYQQLLCPLPPSPERPAPW